MPYHILTIAPTSFFADYGCHVRILEEIRTLQQLGNTVTVCTYHTGNDVPGIEVKRSLDVPWRKGVQVGSSRHKLYFDAMLSTKALRVALRKKPDIIHAHLHEGALIGYPISRLLGIPLVFDFQGSMTAEMIDHHFLREGSLFHRPLRWLESRINQTAGAIITSSHNAARILRDQFHYPPEKVYPVPDAVDTERFKPAFNHRAEEDKINLKRQLGIPLDRQIVVYLGLLAKYQGTDVLLEAAKYLRPTRPDLHFVIMGYPGVDSYRELAEYLGLSDHVVFPGRIPYEQAPRYLSLGDVAVSPKMSITEGSGKLLNYMAMGLPTVAFETTVSREILGDLGIYAELGNPVSLGEAIRGALDNHTRRPLGRSLMNQGSTETGLGSRGTVYQESLDGPSALSQLLRTKAIREFSWEKAGQTIMGIYESLTAKEAQPETVVREA